MIIDPSILTNAHFCPFQAHQFRVPPAVPDSVLPSEALLFLALARDAFGAEVVLESGSGKGGSFVAPAALRHERA